jgi:alanyl-tRNA synthetase
MGAAEIRASFLEYFRRQGHSIVPSSPVVLPSDPTLLFANAGMNQFKEIFLGARTAESRRVADTQKCIRVSGKHNDLEEVGRDTYHHTFFEMLGNWSFGDYYKREAIRWAWELLTEVWKLPRERLWVTIYREDDEAGQIWREVTNVDPAHILKFGEKENFWEMGETGPCGPCSEIHFDRTVKGCPAEWVNAGNPEVMEIWNLVFIQYNRRSDGTLEELPAKHVDTGMGLERVTAVIQGKASNYDTDLFVPIIRHIAVLSGQAYEGEAGVAMRVIADHLRTLAFAIADGVSPSNEGRGYVLRRLLRRAVRFGRKLGFERPFLGDLLPELERVMGTAFPELTLHRTEILRALRAEEESFAGTLGRGLELFNEVVNSVMAGGGKAFPGTEAFKLYDTFGFPIDLTVLMAGEKGLTVDEEAFRALMEEQRQRARAARRNAAGDRIGDLVADLVAQGLKTEFKGYDGLKDSGRVLAVISPEAGQVDALEQGEEGALLLSTTPFYAEKGGQVGDTGRMVSGPNEWVVTDTQVPAEGLILHYGRVARGRINRGQQLETEVDAERRAAIARHHTATHLLQCALREIVGSGVKQAGSSVSPERMRFDFNYFQALTPEQLSQVEARVNELIVRNDPVTTRSMALKDVPGSGIIALFDEKYGEQVRVVQVGDYSRELCGGTHVTATGTLGAFRIVAESSIASGVRRIEGLAGLPAYAMAAHDRSLLNQVAARFSVSIEDIPGRVETLSGQVRELEKKVREMETRLALGQVDTLLAARGEAGGVPLVSAVVENQAGDTLKSLADVLLARMGSGVVALGSAFEGKAGFIVCVSDDWVKRGIHAGKVVKAIAAVAGGNGGGQPAQARAGGRDPARIPEAMTKAKEVVAAMAGCG